MRQPRQREMWEDLAEGCLGIICLALVATVIGVLFG